MNPPMTPPADEMRALAARCEAAKAADRGIDLAIYLLLNPDGDVARMMARGTEGLDGSSRFAWELRESALLFEQRNERGDCTYNGGIPVSRYTASLDAAMSLVPEHSLWATGSDIDGPFARVMPPVRDGWVGSEQQHCLAATPALALCAAALRARASLMENAGG